MIHTAAVLLVVASATACTQGQQRRAAPANAGGSESTVPVLLRYLPPERGGPRAYPEAQVGGILDLSGPCVRLQGNRVTTVVSAPGPNVGRDSAGPYVQSGSERLRHGSPVTGGGGWFDNLPELGPIDRAVPEQCRSGPFVVVTGMQRYNPDDQPPPRSPPPPSG